MKLALIPLLFLSWSPVTSREVTAEQEVACDANVIGEDAATKCKRKCNSKCEGASNKAKCVAECRRACDR